MASVFNCTNNIYFVNDTLQQKKKIAYNAGLSVKETYYAHFRVQQFIMGD